MTKATHKKTTVDVIKQQKKNAKRQAGMGRQQASGVSAASAGTTSLAQTSGSSSASGNNVDINSLSITGGTMMGPLAFWGVGATISSGVIDIGSQTNSYSSRIIVTAESIPDDLITITGATNSGQLLFLQVINGHTVVLKQHTGTNTGGNINIPGGSDFTVNSQDIVLLQWDTTNKAHDDYGGQWTLVSSSSSSSSGATRELDNLQNTAVNADIIPATASSVDLGSLTKPYDKTYSDEVVFVTEGAISTNKPTIGWGNSTRGMTFSMHNLGSTQNAWTWEENGTTKMSLTNGGLLTVGTMLSTSLLRAEGDTELGNATSDDLTITARVDSDIIPKTTQSHDLGDTDRWWDKLYSMYVYTNRVTLSGSNAQIDMGNYPINNCGDIDFDGTEDIKRSGTTMLTFGSSAITTGDYKDLVLGSAAYLQVSATSSTAPSGAFDGFFYVKNTSGSFVKVPYYTP